MYGYKTVAIASLDGTVGRSMHNALLALRNALLDGFEALRAAEYLPD